MKFFSLIKKGDIHLDSKKKLLPADEISTLINAEEALEKANRDAVDLLEETREECEKLRQNAKDEGFEEGLSKFNQQILHLEKQIKELRIETQRSVLPLALKAAKKIVGEELKTYPDRILDIVTQTIKPVMQAKHIRIFVCKSDKEMLETEKDKIKEKLDQVEVLTLEERDGLEPGSCIIETEAGIINATLENQWRAIESAFEMYMKH